MQKLLSIKQASELLSVKPATLRAWRLRRKNLPFVNIGRAVRIDAEALEEYIRQNTVPPREVRR
jgi:excisionase family DNA binding protein